MSLAAAASARCTSCSTISGAETLASSSVGLVSVNIILHSIRVSDQLVQSVLVLHDHAKPLRNDGPLTAKLLLRLQEAGHRAAVAVPNAKADGHAGQGHRAAPGNRPQPPVGSGVLQTAAAQIAHDLLRRSIPICLVVIGRSRRLEHVLQLGIVHSSLLDLASRRLSFAFAAKTRHATVATEEPSARAASRWSKPSQTVSTMAARCLGGSFINAVCTCSSGLWASAGVCKASADSAQAA